MKTKNLLKPDGEKDVKLSKEVGNIAAQTIKKKKAYVKPVMQKETFMPNEYIAACGNLFCALPGPDPTIEDGETPTYVEYWTHQSGSMDTENHRNNAHSYNNGWSMGPEHGTCAKGSTTWRDGGTATEISNPNATINGVSIGAQTGTDSDGRKIYSATWTTGGYSHVGFIHIDANRPNHS